MTSLFQKRVYKFVKKIPKGKVLTYKKVAELAGNPKAWRAVGNILSKNPEGKQASYGAGKNPRIPCHRVIRSDGKIGGYNRGTKKKKYLLLKESVVIKNSSSFTK